MAKRAMTDEAKALKAAAILDQAAEMFATSQYDTIKMSDIANEMGMSKGILFVYFKTKESLFFHLLCREYEKRLERLMEMISEKPVKNFEDFKHLIIDELIELVDHNPLYIRLEGMRSTVLEHNVDPEIMLKLKTDLYHGMMNMTNLITANGILEASDVMDVFQAQASIIIGCHLSTSMPPALVEIVEKNALEGFKRDFRQDVIRTMSNYLEGYHKETIYGKQ
ncbi:TetR/AcrR family transcriptional regulator [Paenibacillus sp. CAU 1782]